MLGRQDSQPQITQVTAFALEQQLLWQSWTWRILIFKLGQMRKFIIQMIYQTRLSLSGIIISFITNFGPVLYRKQQKLSRRTLSWFLQIFDELQKFSLPIDRHCTVDIIMEAKSQRFSHKSYQTAKLFSRLTFVVYGI